MILPKLSLAVAALALAAPAAAEVVKEDETGFVTRDTALVSVPPFEVWQTLIAPARWWNDGHTWSGDAENMYISAQAGGCFCELLPLPSDAPEGVRRGSSHHMSVLLADPPRALRMRGALGPLQSEPVDGVLTVTMREEEGGTRIVWEYVVGGYMRFEVPVIAKAVDGVMSQQLNGLAKLLGKVEEDSADEAEPAGADEEAAPEPAEPPETDEADEADDADDETAPADPAPESRTPSVEDAFGDLIDDE